MRTRGSNVKRPKMMTRANNAPWPPPGRHRGMAPCIIARVQSALAPLVPLFERERSAGRPVVLAVLLHTLGSTYQRPGTLLLIAEGGEYAGLIAGGCLEGDLAEHARQVRATGEAKIVRYDLRNPDDLVWGLGSGCEGAMNILLLRAGPREQWQPLHAMTAALASREPTAIGIVAQSSDPEVPLGTLLLPGDAQADALSPSARKMRLAPSVCESLEGAKHACAPAWVEAPGCRLLLLPMALPPSVLLLGAGPDAVPVADFGARLHWRITVVDHRPTYALASRFPLAERVVLARPEALSETLEPARFTAAVVMSHHLPTDLEYLRTLSRHAPPYVGLLGPPARRDKLLAELGADSARLSGHLHAPVGLNLGGRSPEAIALSIVAEILAFVHGRVE